MEMPEGFKKLDDNLPEGHFHYHAVRNALDLMQEMAEALQSYAADSFDATSLGDFDDEGQGKLARSVLKKFNNWK